MRALLSLIGTLLICTTLSAQCPYDLNNDGIVNIDGDVFLQLGAFGSDDANSDYNSNGISDVRDLFELVRYVSTPCPVDQVPLSSGRIQEVFLVEYYSHDEAIDDGFGPVIEAGSMTYRLYARLTDETDFVLGLFGDAQDPLSVTTSSPLYQHPAGAALAKDVTTAFLPLFEGLAYDSWLSLSVAPEDQPSFDHQLTPFSQQSFEDEVENNLGWTWDSDAGAAWYTISTAFEPGLTGDLRVLAQFTLPPGESIEGVINLQILTMTSQGGSTVASYEEAFGLTFSSASALVAGCTDPGASNYNPAAVVDNGTCFLLGDFDGDGIVGTDDLLDLISEMGCNDCQESDITGDGIVNVQDLLVFLTAFGG